MRYFEAAYEARSAPYFQESAKSPIIDLHLDFLGRIAGGKGRLLDIGSGDGGFCRAAFAKGWDVVGVDPAGHDRSERSKDGTELRLVRGTLPDIDVASFDAVTMWDIVEHVERPLELVRAAKEKVRPGGHLVIETGNYQSVGRMEAGPRWWCYQTDHRWYFGPPVLIRMLQAAGFEAITLCDRMLRPWWKAEATRNVSILSWARRIAHRPLEARSVTETHLNVRRAAVCWPTWANLGIFAMSARKPPVQAPDAGAGGA